VTQQEYREVVWEIVTTVGVWLLLMFLGTNIIGFASPSILDKRLEEDFGHELINKEAKLLSARSRILGIFLIVAYLAIVSYWGLALAGAALMLMLSRIRDQIWEIQHGRRIELKDMGYSPLQVVSTLATWAALPVIWAALYLG